MSEKIPRPKKEKIHKDKEGAAEGELTPQEWQEKLRKLIEGMEG